MSSARSSDFNEPGFLKKLRNWHDAMPWLALGQCLSAATSLVATLLSFAALGLGWWGCMFLESARGDASANQPPLALHVGSQLGVDFLPPELRIDTVPSIAGAHAYLTSPLRQLPNATEFRLITTRIAQQFWLFAVWIIPAGYVLRHALLDVAGRERMSSSASFRLTFARSQSFLSGPALTLGAAAFLAIYFVLFGLVANIPAIGSSLSLIGGVFGIPVALAIGVLVFGTILTFPLMWASVVAEPYADGFDAASRGFEYVIQRPFRFAAYVVIAIILSCVAINLVNAVVSIAWWISRSAFAMTGPSEMIMPRSLGMFLFWLPEVFAINLLWSFSAGVYLMLRRDANHQDVEDVWEPELPAGRPLPELNLEPAVATPGEDRKTPEGDNEPAK